MSIWDERERADKHFRGLERKVLEEVYNNVLTHYNTGRIGGTDFHVLTSVLYDAMQDQREYETCDGCRWWNVRPQRCSCCRRNRALKDGYEERKPEVPLP